MTDTLQQLLLAIQNLAPKVWAIYVKQVTVESIFYSLLLVVSSGFLIVWILRMKEHWKNNDEVERMIDIIVLAFLSFFTICIMGSALGRAINPEYYAIQMLLGGTQ